MPSATSVRLTEGQRTALLGAAGVVLFLLGWEALGRSRLLGPTWPPLTAVLAFLLDPARQLLFARALGASLAALGTGYAAGLVAGVLAAVAGHLVPRLGPGFDRTSGFVHAIPSVALAPLLILLLGRDGTPAALAGINTFFILYVSTTSGLSVAAASLRDLITVLGGGRWTRLVRVEAPSALPVVVSGMRLAVPGALIGVIIGEWFGATRGIGVLVINAMQNFQIPLLWSAVLLGVLVSMLFYVLFGLLHRGVVARFGS